MKLSVIIPVYNTGHLVKNAISSVKKSKINCEIICINDGSKDDSLVKLKEIKEEFNDIIIFDKSNEGLSDTRNYGILKSTGDYLFFLDSDDEVDPIELKKLFDLCNNNMDILHANFLYTYEANDDKSKNKDQLEFEGAGQQLISEGLLQDKFSMLACINLYRKEFLIENNLFFKPGIYHEDEEFNLRAFSYATLVKSTNIPFYLYLQRQSSITNSQDNVSKRFEDIVWIHEEIYNFLVISSHIEKNYFKTCQTYISFMVIFGFCRIEDTMLKKKYFMKIKQLNLAKKINSSILIYQIAKYGIKFTPKLFLKSFTMLLNYRNKKLKLN